MKKKKGLKEKKEQVRTCYKFRLYPTKQQVEKLNFMREQCKRMYNYLLWELKIQFEKGKINRGYIQHQATIFKNLDENMQRVLFSPLQYQNWKIFRQLKGLRSVKQKGEKVGMMKSKRFNEFKTIDFCQSGFKLFYKQGGYGKLKIGTSNKGNPNKRIKIGKIPVRIHRQIEGEIKHIRIINDNKKWYVFIVTDFIKKRKGKNNIIGIDFGLKKYIVDSDNNSFNPPKILKRFSDELAKKNKDLSKKKRGSKNRKKCKKGLNKVYEKIINCREDFLHKLSDYYVKNYKKIIIEDLNIKEMMKKKDKEGKNKKRVVSNKNIADASWYKFTQMLEYKLKQSGGRLIKVNPKNTTQTCSKCGEIKKGKNKLTLRDRIYKCDKCQLEIDRDYNAALNILKRGKKVLKLESYKQPKHL